MKTFEFPEPSPKQELFLTADNTYIAFGGARGGGKSWAVRIKAVLLCLYYPGIKVMIVRKTYPELQENHIIPLCEMLNCYAPRKKDRLASYNDSKKHIKFKNEGVKWTPPQVFAKIHEIEREHRWLAGKKIIGIADPAIWDAETGESIADVASRHQVYFTPGDHKRIPGWMQVHYRLAFDDNGYPMMYVFSNCKAFIRTMPLLQYDEHKPEDLDTDGEDHVADEVRYFCMSRPIKPAHAAAVDEYGKTPMAMFLDIPKEDVRSRPKRMKMEIIDDEV